MDDYAFELQKNIKKNADEGKKIAEKTAESKKNVAAVDSKIK